MKKERFLTVMVPITDDDVTPASQSSLGYQSLPALIAAISPTIDNINNIYKVNGVGYYRTWLNPATNQYAYQLVTDREFPELGKPLEIFDFTYDATRMGPAPTITASAKWPYCLDEYWIQECFVSFFGEKFYLKQIPTSSKSNDDARYKHEILMVSERIVLETTYLFDIVNPYFTDRPISEASTFRFFGDIEDLRRRLNTSLVYAGLSSFVRKTDSNGNLIEQNVLTYDQWQQVGLGLLSAPDPYNVMTPEGDYTHYHNNIYDHYDGSYEAYLKDRVWETDTNGDYIQVGYKVVLGTDADGHPVTSEEKFVEFSDNYIHEGLQKIKDDFELQYYFTKDSDGNTLIVIGDCEHNFGTNNAFSYGVDNQLLSIEKTNTTDKIVTRITGVGSTENIPWYYPNPCADGWIEPFYKRGNNVVTSPSVAPTYTEEEGAEYEKFLKNRLGVQLRYGNEIAFFNIGTDQAQLYGRQSGDYWILSVSFITTVDDDSFFSVYNINNISSNADHVVFVVNKYDPAAVNPSTNPEGWTTVGTWNTTETLQAHTFTAGRYRITVNFYFTAQPQNSTFNGYYIPAPNLSRNLGSEKHPRIIRAVPLYVSKNVPFDRVLTLHCKWDDSFSGYWWYYYDTNGVEINTLDVPSNFTHLTSDVYWTITNVKILTDLTASDGGWNGKYYNFNIDGGSIRNQVETNYLPNDSIYQQLLSGRIRVSLKRWVIDQYNTPVNLPDYGLAVTGTPEFGDIIAFKRVKYITPQQNLMPEIFFRSDGARRFYEAKQYRYPSSAAEANADYTATPDTPAGEVSRQWNPGIDPESSSAVWNSVQHAALYGKHNTLYQSDTQGYYIFENLFIPGLPKEHIENFEDIRPTIEEAKNSSNRRIDVIEEFAYDTYDDNSIWEDGGESGEYKHPHFFAKLRPLGFNIFDHALQEDMIISIKTGDCGACNFKIKVSDKTKKNVVQLWKDTLYEKTGESSYSVYVHAGDLKRYGTYPALYVLDNGTYKRYNINTDRIDTTLVSERDTIGLLDDELSSINIYNIGVLDAERIENGELGTLNASGWRHLEGDVVVTGRAQTDVINNINQQDTTSNYCWVALEKDVDTYGTIMPSANSVYDDQLWSVYIRPKSIQDVHTDSSTATQDEANADKFVFLNIRMPQLYIRQAEHKLSKKLVRYMFDNNSQRFNFSIKFSRIYLAENLSIEELLNENSVLYVQYSTTQRKYKQYVSHYTYIMKHDAVLPEINVEMNQELSVYRNKDEQARFVLSANRWDHWRRAREIVGSIDTRFGRRYIPFNRDVIISGNMASLSTKQSMQTIKIDKDDLRNRLLLQNGHIIRQQSTLAYGMYKKDDFEFDNTNGEINIGENKFIAKIDPTARKLKLGVFSDEEGFTPDSMDIVSLEAGGKRIKVGSTEVAPAFVDSNGKIADYASNGNENHSITPAKQSDLNIVRHTVEQRFIDKGWANSSPTCGGTSHLPSKNITTVTIDNVQYLFWTNANGENISYQGSGSGQCQTDPF